MSISRKTFDLEVKAGNGSSLAEDTGVFRAYVARFGNVDRVNEVISPGAFKTVESFISNGWIGVNHNMASLPIAYIESAVQDSHGLLVSAKWHSTPEAQACRAVVTERLKAGKSVKCSIGYKVLDSFKDIQDGRSVTRLTSLDLFEASIVNLPANPAADVLSAKSEGGKVLTLDDLKTWLDAETKAGRVLSRSNHGRLKEWHGSLSSMCEQIKEMVDTHDPDRPDEADDETKAANPAVETGKLIDKLRAASLRARLSLLSSHSEV